MQLLRQHACGIAYAFRDSALYWDALIFRRKVERARWFAAIRLRPQTRSREVSTANGPHPHPVVQSPVGLRISCHAGARSRAHGARPARQRRDKPRRGRICDARPSAGQGSRRRAGDPADGHARRTGYVDARHHTRHPRFSRAGREFRLSQRSAGGKRRHLYPLCQPHCGHGAGDESGRRDADRHRRRIVWQ